MLKSPRGMSVRNRLLQGQEGTREKKPSPEQHVEHKGSQRPPRERIARSCST